MSFSMHLFSFKTATDQNFYYQSPQRFQSPFPASRNGFFPTNGLQNFPQNLPQSLTRSQLGGAVQQPQQQPQIQSPQQDQSAFFGAISLKNDGSTSDYFQYSAFPVSFNVIVGILAFSCFV